MVTQTARGTAGSWAVTRTVGQTCGTRAYAATLGDLADRCLLLRRVTEDVGVKQRDDDRDHESRPSENVHKPQLSQRVRCLRSGTAAPGIGRAPCGDRAAEPYREPVGWLR